jgi:hypothetical protein
MEDLVFVWLVQYTAKHAQHLLIIANHATAWEELGTISATANV